MSSIRTFTYKGVVIFVTCDDNGWRCYVPELDYRTEPYPFELQAEADAKNAVDAS